MSDVEITIRLPEALVEEARAAGVQVDNLSPQFASVVEAEIKRKEARKALYS